MTTAHNRLTRYLTATGWLAPEEPGHAGSLWRHPRSDLLLPVPHDVVADGLDWQRLAERIAVVEDAEVTDVLARIDARLVDIANLRAANEVVIRDTIPYSAGVTMVRESWTMLRAAATTSLGTRSHIRRYRKSADEIIDEARMAHTKRGSYIIPIHLPLPEPEAVGETFLGSDLHMASESPPRRVMRTFAQALTAIDELGVQPEREPTSDAIHEMIRAGGSHEFSAALQRVLGEEAVSEFSASFVWAAGVGPVPSTPKLVNIPAAARDRVNGIARKMRAVAPSRQTEYLTGPIVGLHRDEGTQAGTVTVQVSRHARLASVTVNVSPERLQQALDWMKAHETVYVESRVHRTSQGLMAEARDAVAPMRIQQLGGDHPAL